MGLMKVLDKFRTKSSLKVPDNGAEQKKKMKKARSIRVAPKKPLLLQPASRATEEAPNYMKSTTSYDQRKDMKQVTTVTKTTKISTAARVLVKNPSLKKNKGTAKSAQLKQPGRADCSSTITDSKILKVADQDCSYSYCSLHGHKHDAVPSLKRFLSRKMQKSMKLRGYSSIEKKGGKEIELVDDVVNELFIEIHTKLQKQCSKQGIQMEEAINMNTVTSLGDQSDSVLMQDSCSVTSVEDCADQKSELTMEEIQVIDQFLEYIQKECEEESECEDSASMASEQPLMELINNPKVERSRSGRSRSLKNRVGIKGFNPRPPRQLELQAESDQEQVNLKHQAVEERKAAEEWMIDYALRKAIRRLTSVRKTKVPQLVAAFETVLPQKV